MKIINITILILFILVPAEADQSDPHLDKLFGELLLQDNTKNYEYLIEKIWEIWLDPSDPSIKKDFNIALSLMKKFRYKQSIFFLSRVIDKNPNFAEAWNKRATAYFIVGDIERSIFDINKTLILEPRHFGAMDGLALINIRYKNYHQAIKIYEEILKILPQDLNAIKRIEQLEKIISEKI